MAKMLTPRSRLIERWVVRESAWCARANRWGRIARFRRLMTWVSRIGDGPVWYALMASLVLVDGMRGLIATLHMAAAPSAEIYHLSAGEDSPTLHEIAGAIARHKGKRPPVFLPAHMTMILSDMPISSGISELIMMMLLPLAASSAMIV